MLSTRINPCTKMLSIGLRANTHSPPSPPSPPGPQGISTTTVVRPIPTRVPCTMSPPTAPAAAASTVSAAILATTLPALALLPVLPPSHPHEWMSSFDSVPLEVRHSLPETPTEWAELLVQCEAILTFVLNNLLPRNTPLIVRGPVATYQVFTSHCHVRNRMLHWFIAGQGGPLPLQHWLDSLPGRPGMGAVTFEGRAGYNGEQFVWPLEHIFFTNIATGLKFLSVVQINSLTKHALLTWFARKSSDTLKAVRACTLFLHAPLIAVEPLLSFLFSPNMPSHTAAVAICP